MRRSIIGALLATFVGASLLLTGSASANPDNLGKLKITVMGTNAVGKDTNANRNSEYVWLKNVTATELNVANWSVSDAVGGTNRTTFNEVFVEQCDCGLTWVADGDEATAGAQPKVALPAGDNIIVYSGPGQDTQPDNATHAFYKNYRHYLNNTSGETVTVRDSDGTTVERLGYDAYGINPLG
jgi:lamin tail-like protein